MDGEKSVGKYEGKYEYLYHIADAKFRLLALHLKKHLGMLRLPCSM
ncbi:MAG: hypothetical protein MPEBLZ_02131 [Candidatus Methanoperedens nitroreducens]|uniref:Uncharacterized protein n=1 Tax=Candidatus Methanoperedens nitratireducens TaxID=1392998 RepID=A0A0P8C926_9EURY|nr:MAG: hypothetical protein MPEBLZ_02131 [Candidatus Methanoperedens sp. BLZ1]